MKFFVDGEWVNPCAKPVHIFHNGNWLLIGQGTKYFLNGQWIPINCGDTFKWIVDDTASYCEQSTDEDIPNNAFIDTIGANPQTGTTNKWKFRLRVTEPLTTNLTVSISGFYDNIAGTELIAFTHLLTLQANNLEVTDENWLIDSSPAGGISGLAIASSTPIDGTNVTSTVDGRVYPLKLKINDG